MLMSDYDMKMKNGRWSTLLEKFYDQMWSVHIIYKCRYTKYYVNWYIHVTFVAHSMSNVWADNFILLWCFDFEENTEKSSDHVSKMQINLPTQIQIANLAHVRPGNLSIR